MCVCVARICSLLNDYWRLLSLSFFDHDSTQFGYCVSLQLRLRQPHCNCMCADSTWVVVICLGFFLLLRSVCFFQTNQWWPYCLRYRSANWPKTQRILRIMCSNAIECFVVVCFGSYTRLTWFESGDEPLDVNPIDVLWYFCLDLIQMRKLWNIKYYKILKLQSKTPLNWGRGVVADFDE